MHAMPDAMTAAMCPLIQPCSGVLRPRIYAAGWQGYPTDDDAADCCISMNPHSHSSPSPSPSPLGPSFR